MFRIVFRHFELITIDCVYVFLFLTFLNPFNSHQMKIQCLWGARLKHPHCCVPASWGPARLMCGESGEFCLPQQSWGVQYDAECSHPSTTTLHQSWTDRPVNMRGSPRSDTLQPGDTPLHITGNTHDHQVCLRLCLCICLCHCHHLSLLMSSSFQWCIICGVWRDSGMIWRPYIGNVKVMTEPQTDKQTNRQNFNL